MCKFDRMNQAQENEELLPYKNIADPLKNDVLSGRGGGTNHHPGNKLYRKMVEDAKVEYLGCTRLEKPLVALRIVKHIRQANGRFLKFDKKSGLWNDVGDKKAREKTSQALREQAPEIRKTLDPTTAKQPWDIDDIEDIQDQVPNVETETSTGVLGSLDDNEEVFSKAYSDYSDPEEEQGDLSDLLTTPFLEYPHAEKTKPSGWSQRDHSLALNPLPHATLKVAAVEDFVHDAVPQKQKSKRMTSHQNETPETRRGIQSEEGQSSVKRASINLEDRMSSLDLDLDSLGADFIVPSGRRPERLTSADLLELVGPPAVEEV